MAKVALLIGVSEYEAELSALPAAVNDLSAIKEVLINPKIGGFVETNVTLLKNPNRQIMEEAIYMLFSGRHRDDLLLLFFSGHGIKDDSGALYLATRSTRKSQGELITPTAVSANFIHSRMSRSRSKRQVVILDSCFSGAFAEGLAAKDDGSIDIRSQLGGEGRAVLTSSSSTQYSFAHEGEDLSLYTRFLIEGIKTGDADLDEDDFISVDELHEYARQKVQEVRPEVKPELYAVREGFKIRLLKAPQGDPYQKYRREVARCGKRGDLTIVNRSILDAWRVKLGISTEEAKALENEILAPYRKEFQQKLQQYERVVIEVFERDQEINSAVRQELQNLQKVLDLRNEDTVPIEAKVSNAFKARLQALQEYRKLFSGHVRQGYPLSDSVRLELQKQRQNLNLNEVDIASIETEVISDEKQYRRNLQQYEKTFLTSIQKEYPLTATRKNELRQYQQHLGLTDSAIAPIEAKITAQVETYQQKIDQYRSAFVNATKCRYQLDASTRSKLNQTWQRLGLEKEDVRAIEAPILVQVETYQENLRQFEQKLINAVEKQYPLSNKDSYELSQSQNSLHLLDEDVNRVRERIIASVEERLQKLRQYEQVFLSSIRYEFPVSDSSRRELKRFQNVLELRDGEVVKIESKVIEQSRHGANQTKKSATKQTLVNHRPEAQTSSHKSGNTQSQKTVLSTSTVANSPLLKQNDEIFGRTSNFFSVFANSSKKLGLVGGIILFIGLLVAIFPGLRWRLAPKPDYSNSDASTEAPVTSSNTTTDEGPYVVPELNVQDYIRLSAVVSPNTASSAAGSDITESETAEAIAKSDFGVPLLYPSPEIGLDTNPNDITATVATGAIVQVIEKQAAEDGSSWVRVKVCSIPSGESLSDVPAETDAALEQTDTTAGLNVPESTDVDQPLMLDPGGEGWMVEARLAVIARPIENLQPSQQGSCDS